MKKLTPTQVQREIARRNRVYKKATKAEKRVLIAKDVIKQINGGKFKPQTGSFVVIPTVTFDRDWDDSLQVALLSDRGTCTCCALGSMVLSCTMFANQQTVGDATSGGSVCELGSALERGNLRNGFHKLLSERQYRLIEFAFESGDGYFSASSKWDDKLSYTAREKAYGFANKYPKERDRLLAIMKNIVKNGGTFKP